jgi:hypothetical protein
MCMTIRIDGADYDTIELPQLNDAEGEPIFTSLDPKRTIRAPQRSDSAPGMR